MADLMQSIQDMLKEETWTRATISNYTQNNLKELADLVEKAKSEGIIKEVHEVCQEHLSHSKDSIIALYICGILDLQNGSLDNSNLVTLVDIFQKNHKENIVTYLCESILADDENNKFALRTLADSYLAEGNDKVWELYEKLVRIDFEEADLAKLLAEHYETAGNLDNAVSYYKKAILRFINANNYNACKEVWTKLVQLMPEEFDFFQNLRRKISKQMGDTKTVNLMQELYNYYKDNKKWDTAITILKQNLEIESKDNWSRKEITDCFRGKYASHSHLEDYIRSSNLTQNYRNVFEAISDFEKHIAFDKGGFVFHRNWGVGIIKSLDNDTLTINFGKAAGIHEIKLSMAVTALKPLAKDHIWVLKALNYVKEGDKKIPLAEKIKKDKEWTLKTIIKSYDNNCDLKTIKNELVRTVTEKDGKTKTEYGILKSGEWTSWNAAAKKILETNPVFGVNPNDINMYTVREGKIKPEEKLSNEFKAQKQFFARLDILMKFFNNEELDTTSDDFIAMYSDIAGYAKNIKSIKNTKENETPAKEIASYLTVRYISIKEPQLVVPIKETFAEIYSWIKNPRKLYSELKDSKNTHLREDFLECIKMLPNWNVEYIRLFPTVLDMKLLNDLIDKGFTADVQKLVKTSFESFRDYRETVLFFFEKCQNLEWFKAAGVSYEKQLITLINLIELTFREINNHVNTTDNKKINKKATELLFGDDKTDGPIFTFMFSKDIDTVKKMYTLIDDITDIDPTIKSKARNKILEKYPDFKFRRVSEESSSQAKGMIVTAKKLAEKKAEIDDIKNVRLENNKVALADAKAKGDLKENAEYQAAKEEKQRLEHTLSKLQEELNRAVIFDPTTSTTAIVSFATEVTLHNNADNKDEVYTILGPWESDPDNNIISYMSPFGNAILDKKVGDTVKFTINEHNYDFTIKEINKAKDF